MLSAIERGLTNIGQQVFEVNALVFPSQRRGDLRVTLAALGRFLRHTNPPQASGESNEMHSLYGREVGGVKQKGVRVLRC